MQANLDRAPIQAPTDGNWFGPVLNDFDAVIARSEIFNREKNPVAALVLNREQLSYVIQQYSLFPKCIVELLCDASSRAASIHWDKVVLELHRNIGEELGSDSMGVSHYELLLRGVREEFNVELRDSLSSSATAHFISTMQSVCYHPEPAISMGAVFALESTAGPELLVVRGLLARLARMEDRSDLTPDGILDNFMKHHIEGWEPGHREGLINTISCYPVTDLQKGQLTVGFHAVIEAMQNWWQGLANEAQAF